MRAIASILYGWAVAVLTGIALGWANGGLTRASAIVSLLSGFVAFGIGCVNAWQRKSAPSARPRAWEWVPIVLFALFTARAFLWLIFRERDDLCVLSPNNLGDMSLHLTFIEYFANGAPFWPDNPIFAEGKLAYSAGVDILNSLLCLAGLDTIKGLIWVGLCGATLTGFALWQWGRGFAVLGFLCVGGLLGWAAFFQSDAQPFFQDYAGNLKYDWAWKSPPLALLVTQRGFLFALPAGLFLLSSWRSRFLKSSERWRLPFAGELLLYAAMPVFHLHTFLALSFVLACWFICSRASRIGIAKLVGAAFLPATFLVYLTVGMFHSSPAGASHVLGWQPGWMVNEQLEKLDPWADFVARYPGMSNWEPHGRFLIFWLGNFGLLPFLALWEVWKLTAKIARRPISAIWPWALGVALVVITPFVHASVLPLMGATAALLASLWIVSDRKETDLTPAAVFFPGAFLFFLCCNVKFAPSSWDNTKLMIWAILLALPPMCEQMREHWPRWVRGAAVVLLFFPGAVILLGGLGPEYQGYSLGKISEIEDVRKATRQLPISATFAAAPAYNHPLLLSGRKVSVGYTGHLWSHGIQFTEAEEHLDALMRGEPDWPKHAASLGASFLFFGEREKAQWPDSTQPWRMNPIVANGPDWVIYDLEKAR